MGENSRTTKVRALVITLTTIGLGMARAMPNPTETAIRAQTRTAGTISGDTLSWMPYSRVTTTRDSTMQGNDSSVYSRKVEVAWAVRGTGNDQVKSKVPSTRCWFTLPGS